MNYIKRKLKPAFPGDKPAWMIQTKYGASRIYREYDRVTQRMVYKQDHSTKTFKLMENAIQYIIELLKHVQTENFKQRNRFPFSPL